MRINKNQIPLISANPIQITYRETANLGLGLYTWLLTVNGLFNPRMDLNPNHLYAFQSMSFSADIEGFDYQAAIDTSLNGGPRFFLQTEGEAGGSILGQPVPLPTYFDDSPFDFWDRNNKTVGADFGSGNMLLMNMRDSNQYMGSFEGRLIQTPALVGKASITMIMRFNLIEIKDEKFAREALEKWG